MLDINSVYLNYKPISVTLNFDWENTTYDERVQMRHDYIEEQKKKDPNYVGYDFPEWFRSSHGISQRSDIFLDTSILVSTIGQRILVFRDKINTTFGHRDPKGYRMILVGKPGSRKWIRTHRIVACTFIPIPEHLKENRYKLVVNHKNDIKSCNLRSNLEWCTQKENLVKAVKTGVIQAKVLKYTVKNIPLAGVNTFYFYSTGELKKYNFDRKSVERALNLNTLCYNGTWEEISTCSLIGITTGIPKDILKLIHNNEYGKNGKYGWIGTIVTEGPCKGERFVVFGKNNLLKLGFSSIKKAKNSKGERKYHGCAWETKPKNECFNIPIGLTEAQKEHLFG